MLPNLLRYKIIIGYQNHTKVSILIYLIWRPITIRWPAAKYSLWCFAVNPYKDINENTDIFLCYFHTHLAKMATFQRPPINMGTHKYTQIGPGTRYPNWYRMRSQKEALNVGPSKYMAVGCYNGSVIIEWQLLTNLHTRYSHFQWKEGECFNWK